MANLVHELINDGAHRSPDAPALGYRGRLLTYAELAGEVDAVKRALLSLGLAAHERVAVYLEQRIETVSAMFGAAAAGGVFVPVNPLLKAEQVAHILHDCGARILVTSSHRLELLRNELGRCPALRNIIMVEASNEKQLQSGVALHAWEEARRAAPEASAAPVIDHDMAAILYTSGSTGKPKGVVLSHRNLVAGAQSVAQYLENTPQDRILCALPLSFDYGLSQLTTAFHSGASARLINYLLPRDVVTAINQDGITGLAAVPPLWIQLAKQSWPEGSSLRYITNSGGAMRLSTLNALRKLLPATKIYLMYGLTEAFRSTYLPPEEIDKRPGSIGKAIPNAEVMVVRPDGSPCAPDESGELVHRGALVAMGYWNDPEKTAERFRPAPGQAEELGLRETAVWSGDTVRMDKEGFLYFVGREDDMIKVSGYRVSPTEVEEVIDASGLAAEAAAFGVEHPSWGQAVLAVVSAAAAAQSEMQIAQEILALCKKKLPAYMVPAHIAVLPDALPRNPNGKIDRKSLQKKFADFFANTDEQS
jgi:acyl-CoA ligase (AMP-forming) (exosortase A-associated)